MKDVVHGIEVDYSRDSLFDVLGLERLKQSYMLPNEESPQERFAYVSSIFGTNKEHSQRLYEYSSKHWLCYSTPILSFGRNKHGLPISCFLPYLADTSEGLVNTLSEVNWLSMYGGGIGLGIGIRSSDEKSVGVMPHLKTYDACSLAYQQGSTRRGSFATYLDISHPDILMFLDMRKPTGDQNMRTLNLHHGINITDKFMNIIENCMKDSNYDDKWELIDPHTKKVKDVVSARKLWEHILLLRMHTGEPYLHFIDTSNRLMPEFQKQKGLSIKQSNLCLTGDTIIEVKLGRVSTVTKIRLDEFASIWNTHKEVYIKSFNEKESDIVWTKVSDYGITGNTNKLISIISHSMREIKCTPEHKIYTKNRGYVEAQYITKDDILNEIVEPKRIKELMDNNHNFNIQKTEITLENEVPVYDVTVPETECFFANGILVHNCSEITLPTDELRTAVCCLSSLNLEYFDEWKNDEYFINDVVEMLDNVLEYFIQHAPDTISRAKYSAIMDHSIGVGNLGFHAYLQKNNIPFASALSKSRNMYLSKHINEHIERANIRLGLIRGEAPDAIGTGRRFCSTTAIAPNASSSIIFGNTSPSVEPFRANVYNQDTKSGRHLHKNKYLEQILLKKCEEDNTLDIDEIWSSIIVNSGSVQHLPFLDDWQKDVFKTAFEIDQRWIIELAADRQKYIDQAQSINLFFSPDIHVKYLHICHFNAWKKGLKTLYYCRSEKIGKVDQISTKIEREKIENDTNYEGCLACE